MHRITKTLLFSALYLLTISVLLSCTSLGEIENQRLQQIPAESHGYNFFEHSKKYPSEETVVFMAFSGGGTRAAAFSYGVLEALRDTTFQDKEKKVRLLDYVDRISSVSGGSFTAAYYGLFGERIFTDFKEEFLYYDVQDELMDILLTPMTWFRYVFDERSHTEDVVDYYDKNIFQEKTFADLETSGGPFIMINATDLATGNPFTFIQQQFDFLCSDLSSFKIARAVTASSAVPVLFEPVFIENFHDCNFSRPDWLIKAESRAQINEDDRLANAVHSMDAYLDIDGAPYVALVDGGVTDNLGLRSLYRNMQFTDNRQEAFEQLYGKDKVKRLVIILVNSATKGDSTIGTSREVPTIVNTVGALTAIPLRLYSTETRSLLKEELEKWSEEFSTGKTRLSPYFIELNFMDIQDPEERDFFNSIPTSFVLEKEQVDRLIEMAGKLLRQNKNYQKLQSDLNLR